MNFTLYNDDCLNALKQMDDNSIDSCVTDPPYGLSSKGNSKGGFMGLAWDYDVPQKEIWQEVFRVLKPGGHLLSFFGSRTYHRGAVQIEDAGFEIRDQIMWLYGSGFPKSHNIGKAIDKEAGAEREIIGTQSTSIGKRFLNKEGPGPGGNKPAVKSRFTGNILGDPVTEEATKWDGWGTALKPSHEPIVVARKPITQTVAKNVLEHGTGALNIDGCRVEFQSNEDKKSVHHPGKCTSRIGQLAGKDGSYVIRGDNDLYWSNNDGWADRESATVFYEDENLIDPIGTVCREPATVRTKFVFQQGNGRWPANVIHDGSDEVVSRFPYTKSGSLTADQQINGGFAGTKNAYGSAKKGGTNTYSSSEGSAARFFYSAKASKADREDGNNHPTVKPTELMKYLCRLVTPKGGTVLDPFMGSGSTGKAALLEGFKFIGIEREKEYYKIAQKRIEYVENNRNSNLEDFFT